MGIGNMNIKHTILIFVLLCCSCSSHYKIHDDRVEHISWNEGQGKVVKVVNGADPQSFQQLLPHFGKDNQNVYWRASSVEGAEPKTFIALNNSYGRDSNHGVVNGKLLTDSNGSSFEYIGSNWAKDSNNYFYMGEKLELCDYDSFYIIKSLLSDRARDKDCLYYGNKKVPVRDPDSLEILPANYAKDKFYVYWGAAIIDGADPVTFQVKDDSSLSIAKDKSTCFSATQVLACKDLNTKGKSFCGCEE